MTVGSAQGCFIRAAQQLALEVLCGTIDGSVKRFLNISLPSLEKGTWIAAGSRQCLWLFTSHGNFKKYCKFQKIGLEFFLRPPWCAPFFFSFFFERHAINILCRRAWLILHSGGYMSKPHLDSWVKYTGQRNLWDPEKLMCRMKRSHLPLLPSTPPPLFFTGSELLAFQPPGCPLCVVMLLSPTSSSREDWMLLNHATLLREAWRMWSERREEPSESAMWGWGGEEGGENGGSRYYTYLKKKSPQRVAFLSASGFRTDLWQYRLFGGSGVHLSE